jgi:hypothetical protein
MDIIAFHECHDLFSAKKYEQQYFEKFKATLNSIEPLPKPKPKVIKEVIKKEKPILYCELCNVYFDTIKLQEAHNKTKKHIKKKESGCEPNMEICCSPKLAKKFYCELCDYECSKESDYNKHLLTRKHKKSYCGVTLDDNESPKIIKYECECGNTYKFRQGLWKHKKRYCGVTNTDKKIPKNPECECGNIYKHRQSLFTHKKKCSIGQVENNNKPTEPEIDTGLIEMLLKNQSVMEKLIEKMEHNGLITKDEYPQLK